MSWYFETDCVNSDGPSITAMVEGETQVTYRTLVRNLGEAFIEKQKDLGYAVGRERDGLRMERDWAVSYHKNTYRGLPCYYFRWSAIEFVFLEAPQ